MMTIPIRSEPAATRKGREAGFSFIEVLVALSILLVGSLSVLSLFSAGVSMAVKRRLDVRAAQAQREVKTIVQELIDKAPPGRPVQDVKDFPLSQRGYTVDIRFRTPEGNIPGVHAVPTLRFQGRPVRVLFPIPGIRSTFDPTASDDPAR